MNVIAANYVDDIFQAAHQGDVATLEMLREHVIPSVPIKRSTSSAKEALVTLLDLAFYYGSPLDGYGLGAPKSERELDATDRTAVWLLERGLELGDLSIIDRALFNHDGQSLINPMSRAMAMLCPRTVLFLIGQGVSPRAPADGDVDREPGGLYAIGAMVESSAWPSKGLAAANMRHLIASAQLARAAQVAILEINGIRKTQPGLPVPY